MLANLQQREIIINIIIEINITINQDFDCLIKPRSNISGKWEICVPSHVACLKLLPLRLVIPNENTKFQGQCTVQPRLWKEQREKFEAVIECEGEKQRQWQRGQPNHFQYSSSQIATCRQMNQDQIQLFILPAKGVRTSGCKSGRLSSQRFSSGRLNLPDGNHSQITKIRQRI